MYINELKTARCMANINCYHVAKLVHGYVFDEHLCFLKTLMHVLYLIE